jgi:hypothetical protein
MPKPLKIVLLLALTQIAWSQTISGIPVRDLTVTGARLMTTSFIDNIQVPTGIVPYKYDEVAVDIFSVGAEPALLCFSAQANRGAWSLLAHLSMVNTPYAW